MKYKFENKILIMKNISNLFSNYFLEIILISVLKIEILKFKINKLKLTQFRIGFFKLTKRKKYIVILYFSILIFFQNNIWYILKIEYGDEKKKIFEKRRECQMNRKYIFLKC